MKTFPGSNGLWSLDVSSGTVQSSDVAALSAFLFRVLTQKPLELTDKLFQSCTLNPPMLSVCKNRCIKWIREIWVVPLKFDNYYTDMVVEVLFSFPTHFEMLWLVMLWLVLLISQKKTCHSTVNLWTCLCILGPQICKRLQKQTKLW